MEIQESSGKALKQSVKNALDIIEGRITRDELFIRLTTNAVNQS